MFLVNCSAYLVIHWNVILHVLCFFSRHFLTGLFLQHFCNHLHVRHNKTCSPLTLTYADVFLSVSLKVIKNRQSNRVGILVQKHRDKLASSFSTMSEDTNAIYVQFETFSIMDTDTKACWVWHFELYGQKQKDTLILKVSAPRRATQNFVVFWHFQHHGQRQSLRLLPLL